ncbi:MAG: hypothetical protein KKH88_01970 [Nanoarchaeota archaeon]|nr:hypothetical protein [Nanoarchaeota archaeon]
MSLITKNVLVDHGKLEEFVKEYLTSLDPQESIRLAFDASRGSRFERGHSRNIPLLSKKASYICPVEGHSEGEKIDKTISVVGPFFGSTQTGFVAGDMGELEELRSYFGSKKKRFSKNQLQLVLGNYAVFLGETRYSANSGIWYNAKEAGSVLDSYHLVSEEGNLSLVDFMLDKFLGELRFWHDDGKIIFEDSNGLDGVHGDTRYLGARRVIERLDDLGLECVYRDTREIDLN